MSSLLPKFYNAWFCPYAQRAWISFLEKGVQFEYIEQDPYNKTPEWLALNPQGLVPTIVHNGKSVYESSVCIQYIDEAWDTGKHLLPTDPYGRAKVRIWSDYISKKLEPPYYRLLMKREESERTQAKEDILKGVSTLMAEMDPEGPFFSGSTLSMVDIMLAPFAVRFQIVLPHFRQFSIPDDKTFKRYHTWYAAVSQHNSVKKTTPEADKLIPVYTRYADGSASSMVAEAIKKGTTLP